MLTYCFACDHANNRKDADLKRVQRDWNKHWRGKFGFKYMQQRWSILMIPRLVLATLAIAGACYVIPAAADEVGVGVGPAGVYVHGDRDRDKTIIEKRGPGVDRDKTVIINKDRDHDADRDRSVVIHHD
jgi:hypothetical protein